MPDVATILRLVEQGALSAEEADQILAALSSTGTPKAGQADADAGTDYTADAEAEPAANGDRDQAGHLRIEISERGRRVVNLRVPVNIASFAAGFVPGLPDDAAERIRSSIRAGLRGPIVDIATDDGDRVLIVNE